jgi:hypothetical protein
MGKGGELEGAIQLDILKYLRFLGFTAAKTKTMGVKRGKSFCFDPWLFRGFADISGFGTINGRFQIFFVEVKTKVGTQSDMQKAFEALCKQAGVI